MAALTVAMERRGAVPGDRRLERLGEDAHRDEACRAGRGRAGTPSRQAPRRPPSLGARPPPRSPQIASARASRRRRMVRRLEAQDEQGGEPSPATSSARPRARRSGGSWPGCSPACDDRADRARARSAKSAKPTRALQRAPRRGWTRTHASVMTPRVPSEPSSSRSGRRAGARRRQAARLPDVAAGVIARTDSTRSSMWVGPVAKWPPARVAIQPPRVEKLERLRDRSAASAVRGELLLEARAGRAGLDARGARHRVDLEHAVERAEVERDGAGVPRPRTGSTPPTTLVPPPYGITARFSPSQRSSTRATSASSRGRATTSGGCAKRAAERADDVEVGRAVGVDARARSSWVQIAASAGGARDARRRQLDAARLLELGGPEAEMRGDAAGRALARRRSAARPRSPSPSACAPRSAHYPPGVR